MNEMTHLGGERAWDMIERVLTALTFGCFGLMALAVCGVSAVQLTGSPGGWKAKLLSLLLAGLTAGGTAVLCRSCPRAPADRCPTSGGTSFALPLLLTVLVLKGSFAALVDTQPVSDFGILYEAAVGLIRDGTPLTHHPYFERWPYQSGPVIYLAALMRLFGTDLLVLKLANALCTAMTSVMVYLLARRFASEGGARGAAVLYTLYPGTWLLVPVLTNQHLSELLVVLALYIYTAPVRDRSRRLGLAGAAGVVLALGNVMRPVAVVALAAGGCLMILEILRERSSGWKAARDALIRFALLAAAYALAVWSMGALVQLNGVNEYGLGNSCPEWKFVCGLNEESRGCWNAADEELIFGSGDPRQTARELALERIQMPPARLIRLLADKMRIMWGGFEATEWMLTPNVAEQLNASPFPGGAERLSRWIQLLSCGFYMLSFLLAAAGGAAALKGYGRQREAAQMLALVALAYFGVHLLIEIQPRYRLLMYAVVFPLTALGLDGLQVLWNKGIPGENNT